MGEADAAKLRGVERGVNFQKCGIEGNAAPWRRRIKSAARKMSTA
jgi:hypothetical protein